MKKLLLAIFILSLFASCVAMTETEIDMSKKTEELMKEANKQTGMPNILNFQEKKTLKMIYELRDKSDLLLYAYNFNPYSGKYIYLGRCVGYGIPYAAQYSSPEKLVKSYYRNEVAMPQPEPNGLYMPTSSSATWLIMINPETKDPEVQYMEPLLSVWTYKLPERLVQ